MTGIDPGDEIEFELPTPQESDHSETDTYKVEEEQEMIPSWIVDWAGCPEAPEFESNTLGLTGGVVSGYGPHSFRGKVYDGFIKDVAGESLYKE